MAIEHWTQIADASTTAQDILDDWQADKPQDPFSSWLQERAALVDPDTFEEHADSTDWNEIARQIKHEAE